MADYKELISGKLSALTDKVRDADPAGAVKDVYAKGTARAKSYAKIAKLSVDNGAKKEELKKIYAEIGRLYYEQAKDEPQGYFVSLFERVAALLNELDTAESEINMLRDDIHESIVPDIEVEIEEEADIDFESVVASFEDPAREN